MKPKNYTIVGIYSAGIEAWDLDPKGRPTWLIRKFDGAEEPEWYEVWEEDANIPHYWWPADAFEDRKFKSLSEARRAIDATGGTAAGAVAEAA